MKIYKEKQFLIFDYENGKTVKYDFATKTAIGKSGKPVKNLCSQLSGLTIDQLCSSCVDVQYGKFLRFVQRNASHYGITNIGTILDRVPYFSNFEQIFSAGIEDTIDKNFKYTINEIPKGLLRLCKEHKIKLSNSFLDSYKKNPDAYTIAYNLEYISLTDDDIYIILNRQMQGFNYETRRWESYSAISKLMNEFGYNAKTLFTYIDCLKTYEAIEDISYLMTEIVDYANMMNKISPKFDKYPRHFLTTHKIATRNYNRLKQQFVERDFQKRIDKDMEKSIGEYCFIYPKSTEEIKHEAVQQNNCVASYIQNVIDGRCHILFLRKKDCPDKSLVTIEVRDNKIVQARQRFNDPVTEEQQEVINKYNKWLSNKTNNESEELKNVG